MRLLYQQITTQLLMLLAHASDLWHSISSWDEVQVARPHFFTSAHENLSMSTVKLSMCLSSLCKRLQNLSSRLLIKIHECFTQFSSPRCCSPWLDWPLHRTPKNTRPLVKCAGRAYYSRWQIINLPPSLSGSVSPNLLATYHHLSSPARPHDVLQMWESGCSVNPVSLVKCTAWCTACNMDLQLHRTLTL